MLLISGSLQELFEEVETSLTNLEDLNEILDLQSRQLDHRFQLALYKEKKLSELNGVKGLLLYFQLKLFSTIYTKNLKQKCKNNCHFSKTRIRARR